MWLEILNYFLLWITVSDKHYISTTGSLTLSWWRSLSYRNQSIDFDLLWWVRFLYDGGLRHERFKWCQLSSDKLKWHWWCHNPKIVWLWENAIPTILAATTLKEQENSKTPKLIILCGHLFLISSFFLFCYRNFFITYSEKTFVFF